MQPTHAVNRPCEGGDPVWSARMAHPLQNGAGFLPSRGRRLSRTHASQKQRPGASQLSGRVDQRAPAQYLGPDLGVLLLRFGTDQRRADDRRNPEIRLVTPNVDDVETPAD